MLVSFLSDFVSMKESLVIFFAINTTGFTHSVGQTWTIAVISRGQAYYSVTMATCTGDTLRDVYINGQVYISRAHTGCMEDSTGKIYV